MASYSFEGQYKRGLVQSLGGRSQTGKAQLLQSAQEKRQLREKVRIQSLKAVVIQSAYRSHRIRKSQFNKVRMEFKHALSDSSVTPSERDIHLLLRALNFFFSTTIDDQLLLAFCGLAVRHQSVVKGYLAAAGPQETYHLKKWLSSLLGVLSRLSDTNENISMGLRVLEIYLPQISTDLQQSYTTELFLHITLHGYFRTLRKLCDSKIPGDIEMSVNPPTALAASLLALILKPLSHLALLKDSNSSVRILRQFCLSFVSPDYTPQVYRFVLPALRSTNSLPLTDLICAVTQKSGSGDITVSPSTLHCVMLTAEHLIDQLDDESCANYLSFLSESFYHLTDDSASSQWDADSDGSEMDWSGVGSGSVSLSQIRSKCLTILNSTCHVTRITRLLDSNSSSKRTTEKYCNLCKLSHCVLSKLRQTVHSNRLLYTLALDNNFLRKLWDLCVTISERNSAGNTVSLIQVLCRGVGDALYNSVEGSVHTLRYLLSTFCSFYYHSALTLHDRDFTRVTSSYLSDDYRSMNAFETSELVSIVSALRDCCLGIIHLAIPDSKPVFDNRRQLLEGLGIISHKEKLISKDSYIKQRSQWIYLFNVTSKLIKHLYIRDSRTHFCPQNHWLSNQVRVQANSLNSLYKNHDEVFEKRPLRSLLPDEEEDGVLLSVVDTRKLVILTELPFVVPFEERVQIFSNLITTDKMSFQSAFDGYGSMTKPIDISIRRDFIYEDAFEKLSSENEPSVKPKIRVSLRNVSGLVEAGIDGGGVFREFLSELLKTGFEPNRGLFKFTASTDKQLYPNPEASTVLENSHQHFFFLGRMLGKALYENMLVELPFASFFLSKILHKSDSDFHQLASLDPTLYKNLLVVKNYEGDVSDLGLDFSLVTESLGVTSYDELKPGGKNIPVTNHNCIEYVQLMADYKLNKQIKPQCRAFTQGLEDIIKVDWLRMFNHHELQVLISGADRPIDVDDLIQHTNYSGDYSASHPTIQMFWKVVREFSPEQKSALLKFTTSCSRPPLLGFKNLYPAFCIHHGGKEIKLPTSSTCMNFLKLPEFHEESILREKLLYAIESGAGFELS